MDKFTPTRRELIEALQELLSDEYNADDFVFLTDGQIMHKIIDAAFYYMGEYNNQD